jgi:hypothetical protein
VLGFGDAVALPLSAEGFGESLFLNDEDGDALDAVLDVSLKELLSGTTSAGGCCEVLLTLTDFALDSIGFEAEPGNGWARLPGMDEPELDVARDETEWPALDNERRLTSEEAEAGTDGDEEPNLRSGELGTDRALRAP